MITNLIEKYLGLSPDLQSKLFLTFIIVFISWGLQKVVIRFFVDKFDDVKVRFQWKKTVKYIIVFFTIIFLARTWFGAFDSIGTYFGLLSAGLAIALQDLLVNFAGWIFILFRKPFTLGDRIEIEGIVGDVIDQRVFQFSVIEIGNWVDADQSTGRIIHIPNGKVFKTHQANYTAGFEYIWHEIPVLVTFESDWKKAKEILTEAVNKHAISLSKEAEKQIKEAAKTFLIFYKTLTPIVYTSVKDSGVMLTIRYLAHVRRRRMTEELIWEEVLEQFAKYDNIDFAYPTTRYYNNLGEGKEGTKSQ
ncbi:MAG: mechanosensitive ion channel domain-containing protein [Melioribacteraceae bacterium]